MAVTAANLIQGAATLWQAPFGTVEPATAIAAPGAGWVDLGATADGVEFTITQEYAQLEADQLYDAPESRLISREITFTTNLLEATVENLKVALNGGTITSAAGSKTYDLAVATGVPVYSAFIIDGFSPAGKKRRIVVRKALNVGDVTFAYKKDEQTAYTVEFRLHHVSDAIKMFSWTDEV